MSNVVTPADDIIILRSVYGKVGMKYYIQPCKDPKTGLYPDCVKPVNSLGDIVLSEKERQSGQVFIKETETFIIEDGTTLDIGRNPLHAAEWEAIKNCVLIAPERYAKDPKTGDYLIDGTVGWKSQRPRYGVAELYVDRPGYEAQKRVSKKKKIHNAGTFILDDSDEGRMKMARLLGKHMKNIASADVTDYLLLIAEKDPDKIINLYTGDDINLRILFMDARDSYIIYVKNKLYLYGDSVILGATDDAVISWMKDPRNRKTLELIKKDTYPDYYEDEDEDENPKPSTEPDNKPGKNK